MGGLLIGIASALLILLNGRIAGISGIVGGILRRTPGDTLWRIIFIFGLIIVPFVYSRLFILPEIQINADYTELTIAGLLVGFGSRYGSGCTSGHGVCGISRLSPRSILATIIFIIMGFLTVYIMRHLLFI